MYYIYVYLYIYICINIYAAFAVNSCAGQDLLLQDVFWDVHQGCSPRMFTKPSTSYYLPKLSIYMWQQQDVTCKLSEHV